MGDMRFVVRLVGVALLATLIGALFVRTGKAAPPRYWVVSVGTLGTDSTYTKPDTVWLVWVDDNRGTWDSVEMVPQYGDSLVWWGQLAAYTEGWGSVYNPMAYAIWRWPDGSKTRDNALGIIPYLGGHLDSLDQSMSVSLNDSIIGVIGDSTDARLSSSHGAGPWGTGAAGSGAYIDSIWVATSSDTTAIGSGVQVWLRPNSGGSILKDASDANSWAEFSVDADTYLVSIWVVGYYQTVVPDTNEVASQDTKDTVYMTATTAGSPSAPGLTPVHFTFYDGTGDSLKNVVVQYQLDATSYAFHYDSTKIIDPARVFEARSNSSGVVTINVIPNDSLYLSGYQTGKTKWKIKAFNGENGAALLGNDGIKINVPASATALVWPQDF